MPRGGNPKQICPWCGKILGDRNNIKRVCPDCGAEFVVNDPQT